MHAENLYTKKIVIISIIVIVVVVLGIGSLYISKITQKQLYIGSVTIGLPYSESSLALYAAQEQGFFSSNGVQVTLHPITSGADVYKALLKGDVDMSVQSEYPILGSLFKKEKVKIISTINTTKVIRIIGNKNLGIRSVSDLSGKKVGLPRNTILEYYLGRYLDLHGMSLDEITLVNIPVSESTKAISNGSVDMIVAVPPFYDSVKKTLGNNAIDWSVQGDQKVYVVLISKNDWISRNPDLVSRVLKAIDQANIYLNRHPDYAKALLKKRVDLNTEAAERDWQRNSYSLSLDQQLILSMEDEARWMIENKLVDAKDIPNFLDYIYFDALERVKPEEVTIIHK